MTSSSARVEWTTGEEALAALDDDWAALAVRQGVPFARPEWLLAWWHAFGNGRRPVVCRIWRDGELAAAAAFLACGHRLQSMTNVHTPILPLLHVDSVALAELARAILSARAGTVRLDALQLDGSDVPALQDAAGGSRRLTLTEPTYVSPLVDTTGEFAAYRAARRGWKPLESRMRKAARQHAMVVNAIDVPRGDLEYLEDGLAVEASGWKGRKGTAIDSHPETARFYRRIAESFAGAGELALSGLWLDGRLVAFDLSLLTADRYWLLKTGYDERFHHLGPGLVLRRAVVERCFELGLDAHEFLGGDQPWKRLFATSGRAHCTWRADRLRPVPVADHAWRRVRPYVRAMYRAVRNDGAPSAV